MSPIIAVTVLFFSILSLASSGEIDDLKKKIEEAKNRITIISNENNVLQKEKETIRKVCDENKTKLTFESSELSAEVNEEMKKAKQLLFNITNAQTVDDDLSVNITKQNILLDKFILHLKLSTEELELLKKRRADGSYDKCVKLFESVAHITLKSKTNTSVEDIVLLLKNELEQLETTFNSLKSESDVLKFERDSEKADCDLKITNLKNAIKDGSKDVKSAKEMVKRFEGELSNLKKSIADKKKIISDLGGKISKEEVQSKKLAKDLASYLKDQVCYKKVDEYFKRFK